MSASHSGAPRLEEISRSAASLVDAAAGAYHRRGLVLAGEAGWCRRAADAALKGASLKRLLWIGDSPPEGAWSFRGPQAHKALGREFDVLVFDAHSGFDPDAFGASAGTIRGGGLLLLLTPPLRAWPAYHDPVHARITVAPFGVGDVTGRFLHRLARVIESAEGLVVVEQGRPIPSLPESLPSVSIRPSADVAGRTPDQRLAVEALMKVATGHRHRPVVLISDRGRGKSAALGIAAARLIGRGIQRIIVTAPRLDAVEPVFEHAKTLLPDADLSRGLLRFGDARIRFAPPDELALTAMSADLVLVDEAAAIPTPLLQRLLDRYARIAFATTIHGYEGTGRGFALRFRKVLDQRTPGWKAIGLDMPIRWAPGDPVEGFVFRALLLDASGAPDEAVATASPEDCITEQLDRDVLAGDEQTLSELFGLLVLAHYRTRPNDLRNLLDGPNVHVYATLYQGHVVATALVAYEGGFDAETARGIFLGLRRPRGHLLAQTLAAHAGLEQAPRLRYARIMRIAVHPTVQGSGFGSRLLHSIIERAQNDGLDGIGASFGATAELLRFWARSEFLPVRMGLTREHTSGTHSAVVLRPLTEAGQALFAVARKRFTEHLPSMLGEPLHDLDPELAIVLLRREDFPPPFTLDDQDWREVVAFAFAQRGYEVSLVPLWKLARVALADPTPGLDEKELGVLVTKVLQKRSWKDVAASLDVAGRAAAVEALRAAARSLILRYGNEKVLLEADRLKCEARRYQ